MKTTNIKTIYGEITNTGNLKFCSEPGFSVKRADVGDYNISVPSHLKPLGAVFTLMADFGEIRYFSNITNVIRYLTAGSGGAAADRYVSFIIIVML